MSNTLFQSFGSFANQFKILMTIGSCRKKETIYTTLLSCWLSNLLTTCRRGYHETLL